MFTQEYICQKKQEKNIEKYNIVSFVAFADY